MSADIKLLITTNKPHNDKLIFCEQQLTKSEEEVNWLVFISSFNNELQLKHCINIKITETYKIFFILNRCHWRRLSSQKTKPMNKTNALSSSVCS